MAANVNKELINASRDFENLVQQVMDEFNQAPSFPVKH